MRATVTGLRVNAPMLGGYLSDMAEAMAIRRANAEVKRARSEAELSIKARSEFLANMNHELRTPLNAIIGFTTMLKDGEAYGLSEEQRDTYTDYILQSADLLLAHLNTILETAALDSGDIEFVQDTVDLAKLLEEAVNRTRVFAGAAETTIEFKSTDDDVLVWADKDRVAQAVDHLVRIAIKLSPKQGRIFVRAIKNDNGWGEIAVRDKSDGLSPEELNMALNVFSEVNRGLDRSFSGTGIDLAIAKTFVELQGGKFSIKSKPGKGMLVRIAFPPPQIVAQAGDVKLAG